MKKGRVYWITGLPGSGKTTIGTALYYKLCENNDNVIILDGDILKQFVGDTVGYTREDRFIRAQKYSNICKILSDQGMWVIICTVALFDSIRDWNRDNIDGYIEVFLDIPYEVLQKRNKKGLYSDNVNNATLFENIEFPQKPDYVIGRNAESVSEAVRSIMKLVPSTESTYDRDRDYWNCIYRKKTIDLEPSNFAKTIINDLKQRGGGVLELGCGNGRDSLFFLESGLRVTAVDASDNAIRELQEKTAGRDAIFVCDDFVKCEALFQVTYESIYSRFTLHAINEKQEDELLKNIKTSLIRGGRLYIEARTTKDDLYGKGTKVDKNAYIYNSHFRRFIDADGLKKKIEQMGLKIVSAVEGRGFSKTSDSDPVLLRLIAEREK